MTPKKSTTNHQEELFRAKLENIIDMSHELVKAAKMLNWEALESHFGATYCPNNGRPAINTRLMLGLQMLRCLHDISDEEVLSVWLQNPYWQYFCGMDYFQHKMPIDPSSMTRWRNRFGDAGVSTIAKALLDAMFDKKIITKSDFKKVTLDTTVQTKAVRYPTDIMLYDRQREHLVGFAKTEGIKLRQNYNEIAKSLIRRYSGYMHAKQFKRAKKVIRSVKCYLGRVVRDIERNAKEMSEGLKRELEQAKKLLKQERHDKNKIYSIHASEVECISKGKAHKPYEFGVKAGFAVSTKSNWILGAIALPNNPYDGHTIEATLESMKEMCGQEPEEVLCDLGYRRKDEIKTGAEVHIVKRSRRGLSRGMKKFWNRRSAIEPIIGHMKSEHGLERNALKGELGDRINVVMSALGYNLKKLLNVLKGQKTLFAKILLSILESLFAKNPLPLQR